MTYPRYRRLSEANKRDYFIVVHYKSGKLTLRLSPNVETYTNEFRYKDRTTNLLKGLRFLYKENMGKLIDIFIKEKYFLIDNV